MASKFASLLGKRALIIAVLVVVAAIAGVAHVHPLFALWENP